MKQLRFMVAVLVLMMTAASFGQSKVYMTKEITPESLVKIYKALGREANGRVAVLPTSKVMLWEASEAC